MTKIITTNPLNRKAIESDRVHVRTGSRIAFNPAKRNMPTLVIGNVDGCSWHKRYGRCVSVRCDDGSRITGIAIDRITVRVVAL